jgi:protein phosphatase
MDPDGGTRVRGETTKPRDVPDEPAARPETTKPSDIPEAARAETTAAHDVPEGARAVTTTTHDVPAEEAPERPSDPGRRPSQPGRPPPARPGSRRTRTWLVALLVIVMVVIVGVGVKYLILDKFFFVGTNHSGLITLYKGAPYDLPFGIALYKQQHVSAVPARTICPLQRKRILDHQLRSKGDATDLVQQVETGRLQQDC